MKNWLKYLLITVASVSLAIILGCSAAQDAVTPCVIGEDAHNYTGQPLKKFMPYTTLLDSKRIAAWTDYTHEGRQAEHRRAAEDDDMLYGFLKGRIAIHQQGAMQFQQTVFSPEGPLGMLFVGLPFGTLGALLIKRPGDKSKKEIETEEKIKNGS